MTVREIRGHLEGIYGIDVSPDLTSAVTDAVLEEVAEWQSRPLDICYPLVFFDAIRVKIRDEGFVRNKAVYIALGILFHRARSGFRKDGNVRPWLGHETGGQELRPKVAVHEVLGHVVIEMTAVTRFSLW